MNQLVKYVGLDVHKETIAVAVAEDGKRASSCGFATKPGPVDTAFSDK